MCDLRVSPNPRSMIVNNVQVARDIGESEVFGAEKLDGRSFEKSVVVFADISRVFCLVSLGPVIMVATDRLLRDRYRGRS